MQRALQPEEVSDLLNRNFNLQAKVLAHTRIVQSGQWDQIRMNTVNVIGLSDTPAGESLPIPTSGLAVRDDKFGYVVVFPDAKGELHFIGDVAATTGANIAGQKPYASASGNTFEQIMNDLKTAFGELAAGLMVGLAIGTLAYLVITHV